jgi:hypothetical protein
MPRIRALQPGGETAHEPTIDVAHVARVVVHIASLPLEVTVLEMNIMYACVPVPGAGDAERCSSP